MDKSILKKIMLFVVSAAIASTIVLIFPILSIFVKDTFVALIAFIALLLSPGLIPIISIVVYILFRMTLFRSGNDNKSRLKRLPKQKPLSADLIARAHQVSQISEAKNNDIQ